MSPEKRSLPGRGTGGWKQSGKMRNVEGGAVVGPIAEAANMDTPSDSVLGAFLLHAICWGMMSVSRSTAPGWILPEQELVPVNNCNLNI